MISNPEHELSIGSLDLIGRTWDNRGFRIRTRTEGTEWGNPEPVLQTIQGALQDGGVVSLDSWQNREFTIQVQVEGTDGQSLAAGVAALEAETRKRNVIIWRHPAEFAELVAFDVEWSHLEVITDDTDMLLRQQAFALVVTAQPFVRSLEPILSPVMSAPPPPDDPVVVAVDTCDSASGWSVSPFPSTVGTTGGYIFNTTYGLNFDLIRAGTIPLSTTPLLVVEWSRAQTDGSRIWVPPVLNYDIWPVMTSVLDAAWARSVYDLSHLGASVNGLVFSFNAYGALAERAFIRHIDRTDQVPTGGATGHQLSRTIRVEGSARTQASLRVWHDTDPLGEVLVHTSPTPHGMISLEPFLDSSSTPAAGTVSGTAKSLSLPVVYMVPADLFDPARASGYLLLARLNRAGTGTLTATAQSRAASTLTGPIQTLTATPPSMSSQTIVCLGRLHMPPMRVRGYEPTIRVAVSLASPSGSPVLDDVWLADIDQGSLTWLRPSLGNNSMRITSPTTEDPYPQVYAESYWGGQVNSWAAEPASHMRHDFPPGDLYVYTVATEVASSKIQLEYYPRGLISLPPRSA